MTTKRLSSSDTGKHRLLVGSAPIRRVVAQMPISNLPTELLGNIFFEVLDVLDPYGIISALTTIMLVCQHWKSIALNAPYLWAQARIDVRNPKALEDNHLANLIISRAKNVPLSLICADLSSTFGPQDGWSSPVKKTVAFIECLAPRLGTLSLMSCHPFSSYPVLRKVVGTVFPVMRKLQLSLPVTFDEDFTLSLAECDAICEYAPMLREVDMTSCPLPWTSKLFSNLTHIYLELSLPSSYSRRFQPTLTEFCVFLRSNAEHLQELRLTGGLLFPYVFAANTDISSLPNNTGWPVKLPQLTVLQVADLSLAPAFLLSCIEIPLTARVQINFWFSPHYGVLLQQLDWDYLHFIIPKRARQHIYHFQAIRVAGFDAKAESNARRVEFFGHRKHIKPTNIPFNSDLHIVLSYSTTSHPLLDAIFSIVHLPTVKLADFERTSWPGLDRVAEFLPQLSAVRELRLAPPEMFPILTKLCGLQQTGSDSECGDNEDERDDLAIPCPLLETLVLNLRGPHPVPGEALVDDAALLSMIKLCLQRRHAANVAVQRLEMKIWPSIYSPWKEKMKSILDLVDEVRPLVAEVILTMEDE